MPFYYRETIETNGDKLEVQQAADHLGHALDQELKYYSRRAQELVSVYITPDRDLE